MKLLWIFLINGIFGVIVLEIKEAYSIHSGADRRRPVFGGICSRSAKIEK
ncbi:hypothetical protein [Bacillus haynesii]